MTKGVLRQAALMTRLAPLGGPGRIFAPARTAKGRLALGAVGMSRQLLGFKVACSISTVAGSSGTSGYPLKKPELERPPRLLCLHGYGQTGDRFREKTGSMRKALKQVQADLVYVDAPFPTDEPRKDAFPSGLSDGYSWWQDAAAARKVPPSAYHGFDASLRMLQGVLEREGPFDGVLGFSQGAMVAALLAALTAPKVNEKGAPAGWDAGGSHPPLFALVFAGFIPYARDLEAYFDGVGQGGGSQARTLHVIGEKDRIIVPERSLRLAGCFHEPRKLMHPKGHLVPSGAEVRREIVDFIVSEMEAGAEREMAEARARFLAARVLQEAGGAGEGGEGEAECPLVF